MMGIYARVAAALAVAGLLFGCAWKGYVLGEKAGKASVQMLWDAEKLEQADVLQRSKEAALKKERALQKTIDQKRKEAAHEVDLLMAERDAALGELRQRPQRQAPGVGATNDQGADAGPSAQRCTGAGLFREDAKFLIGEATRAERTRQELKKCLANFGAVERELNSE
jgi:hypothetical protein